MTVWLTSDLHLYDPWAAGRRWCRRPSVEESVALMHATMARRWDARVAEDDEVWVLGDLTCHHDNLELSEQWILRRPGVKHLIWGNWEEEIDALPFWRSSRAFQLVDDHAKLPIPTEAPDSGGLRVVSMSHYPQRGQVYGHTHTPHKLDPKYPGRVHVGLEAWGHPVHIDDVAALFDRMDDVKGQGDDSQES